MIVQLFRIVPLQALGVGPEVSNNMSKCRIPFLSALLLRRILLSALEFSCVCRCWPCCDLTCELLSAAAPHNCIGGSEVNCLPGPSEAALMFADPSKMQNMDGVPLPSHWYKGPVSIM